MGLKLVIERECSRDHQTALRQFLCCEPGGPEWAMDPQRYQKKGPRYIQATPRTVLYRQSDIEDWLTANTVETEDSKEMKKASAATDAEIK